MKILHALCGLIIFSTLVGNCVYAKVSSPCDDLEASYIDVNSLQISAKQVKVGAVAYDAIASFEGNQNGKLFWKLDGISQSTLLPESCQYQSSLSGNNIFFNKINSLDNSFRYAANFDVLTQNGSNYLVLQNVSSVTPMTNSDENIGVIEQPLTGASASSFWPGTSIPVCWDTWNPDDNQARQWVQSAIETTWQRHSAVRFFGWGQCQGFSQVNDAIRIRVADVNPASQIGTGLRGVSGGMVLNFTYAMWTGARDGEEYCANGGRVPVGFIGSGASTHREYCTKIIAVHEFGHALGFTHEDLRSDRFGCEEPHTGQGTKGNYQITSYDLNSIMNYCNPNWNGFGQLSFLDRWGAISVYGGWSPDFAITPNNAAAGLSSLAAAHRNSDELNIFFQGPDRAIGTNWSNITVNNALWQTPFPVTPPGAGKANTPIAAVSRGNQLHVFYIGPDGALATTWTDGKPWVPPFPITPPSASRVDSPLVAVIRGTQLHVFYIGPDGALASTWSSPNSNDGLWHTPFPITSSGAAAPGSHLDALVRGTQLHVFFQGNDRAFASNWSASDFDNGRWQSAFPITPPGAGIVGSAIDAVLRNGQLHLFYQGSDGALASNWAPSGGKWNSPFPITPPGAARLNTPIAALARNADKLDVHFIGPDGAVATVWANALIQNGKWQTPFPVTPPGYARSNSALVATSRFEKTMDVFYTGQLSEMKTLWSNDPRNE